MPLAGAPTVIETAGEEQVTLRQGNTLVPMTSTLLQASVLLCGRRLATGIEEHTHYAAPMAH